MIIYVTTIPFLPKKRKLSKYWKALQIVKNNSKGMLFSSTSFDSFLQIFHNKYLYVDLHLYKNQYSQNWFKKHNCARRNFCLVKVFKWSHGLLHIILWRMNFTFYQTCFVKLSHWWNIDWLTIDWHWWNEFFCHY